MGDDNIMLYVISDENSGIESGKYLEKGKYKNQEKDQYFSTKDFYIG